MNTTIDNAFTWLIAWIAMIVFLVLINKSRLGHVIIYYALWLMLTFLLVTQYKAITTLLAPIGQPLPKN